MRIAVSWRGRREALYIECGGRGLSLPPQWTSGHGGVSLGLRELDGGSSSGNGETHGQTDDTDIHSQRQRWRHPNRKPSLRLVFAARYTHS